jgi:hypothetical protein
VTESPNITPFGEVFQIAYVTYDLEKGMALFKEHYGIPEFLVVRTRDYPNPAPPYLRLALAYRGRTMIELVEPEATNLDLYIDALRDDGGLAIHHLAYFVTPEEFETLEARFKARGIATPDIRLNGPYPILFADTRQDTGLYSEFLAVPEDKRAKFGRGIPRY